MEVGFGSGKLFCIHFIACFRCSLGTLEFLSLLRVLNLTVSHGAIKHEQPKM